MYYCPCTLLDSERTETAVGTLPAGRRTARTAAVATRRLQQRLSVGRQDGEHSRDPPPRRQQHRRRPNCRVAAMALSRRPRQCCYYYIYILRRRRRCFNAKILSQNRDCGEIFIIFSEKKITRNGACDGGAA